MKIKPYLLTLFIFLFAVLASLGWGQELVTGYYDHANDYFVFEWDNPEYGRMKTIYDPANKIKPLIKSKIEFDINEQDYTYNYEVTNLEGSKQSIDDIFIKHLAPIYNAKAPSPLEDWYMDEYPKKEAFQWAKTGGTPPGILAGQAIDGLSFKSKGLPIIVNSAFTGSKRARFSGPGDSDTEEVTESFERVFNDLKEKYKDKFEYILRKTLGPTAPPADFKPADFLTSIINMKHEAYNLGWIKNEGTLKSLDAKLENAKKDIEKESTRSAKNTLKAFINEVEAQGCESYENCPSGKQLTSEAYGLLKYNALYLIDHL